MHVDRYNYAAQFGDDIDWIIAELRGVLLRGQYDQSKEIARFENAFAAFVGSRYARTVGCGTDALILTLRALGIGPGDEVITQANTFYATVAAIVICGARPVFVDADIETYQMLPEQAAGAITPRTKAIIAVHLYGKPGPIEQLADIARRAGIALIEDAAQAHGAEVRGRRVGTFGIAGCFSFHPSKNLAAAGDAGCVTTDDEALATAIVAHRTHGQLVQHEHIVLGTNSKIDSLQAIVLLSKLPKLDEWNRRRREIAHRYRSLLDGLPVSFQREDDGEVHVYHLFQVRTSWRDELLGFLRNADIDAVVRYPVPVHLQPPFAQLGYRPGDFPNAERLARELLCLPMRADLSDDEIEYVVEQIAAFHKVAVA